MYFPNGLQRLEANNFIGKVYPCDLLCNSYYFFRMRVPNLKQTEYQLVLTHITLLLFIDISRRITLYL